MKAQWENKIMSSFLQFVDHEILDKGEAFQNAAENFYPADDLYYGYHTYSSPFQQLVGDESIGNEHGANIMDGVYVGGSFKEVDDNDVGLVGINHQKGQVYFNQDQGSNVVSGNFAVKDYSVSLTSQSEENLLFHTKHHLRPKTYQPVTGLPYNASTYPIIYIKNAGGTSLPLGFGNGSIEDVRTDVRAVILSDSAFSLDAVCNILKDMTRRTLPIIESTPLNAMGAYIGESYNYTSLATGTGPSIWDIRVSKLAPASSPGLGELDLDIFSAFVDFEIHSLGQKN